MSDKSYLKRVPYFVGADGKHVTLADLPSRTHKRWRSRHKAIVLMAVYTGVLSFEEACERYQLSLDELLSWQRWFESQGMPDLRATMGGKFRR